MRRFSSVAARRRALRSFIADRRGVAALEFAFVCLPFFALIFAILETSVVYYFNVSLDQAVNAVAMKIRSGEIQLSNLTATQLASTYICPRLSAAMTCSNVQISLQPNPACSASDQCWSAYYTDWAKGIRATPSVTSSVYNTGSANQALYMTVVYPMPLISTLWSSASYAVVNGKQVRALVANAIFVRDLAVQN